MKIIPKAIEKLAVEVVPGGLPSRAVSGTLGRLNPLSLANLILSGRSYHSSNKGDRPDKHRALAKAMESAAPDQLDDTVVRLEGTDLVDDLLWKKRHGDQDVGPWYDRVGGRVMQNHRTSLLGKAIGVPKTLSGAVLGNLFRASHYNDATDAASIYGDEPAVTTHELGHAIDFNDKGGPTPDLKRKLVRDGYGMLYGAVPPARLWHEGMANVKSRAALETGLKDKPDDLHDILWRRDRVLPAGYGSYVGSLIPGGGTAGALGGLVAGKTLGVGRSMVREREYAKTKAAPPKDEKKEPAKEAAVIDLVKIAIDPTVPADELRIGPSGTHPAAMVFPGLALGLTPALALGGAALGAAKSPSVYGMQGAGRGALYGSGLGLGAGLGGLLGAGVGGNTGSVIGALAGGGAGLLGARGIMGKHPREKDRDATEARQRMKAEEKARSKMASVNRLARLLCD